MKKKILITTGDHNGIGLEITAKSLREIKLSRDFQLIIFVSDIPVGNYSKKYEQIILSRFKNAVVVNSLEDALSPDLGGYPLVLIRSCLSPGEWVIQSTLACKYGLADGIVTAPLSKTGLKASGLPYIGHTDIFSKILKTKNLRMLFLGRFFNVLLHTDHISLNEASRLSIKPLVKSVKMASEFFKNDPRKICLLGLNPHSGENGLIGSEEVQIEKRLISSFKRLKLHHEIDVFKSPDTAFLKSNWKHYSTYVACYHDQGLIPFKMIHGNETGVHLTLGLPFIRTSVDHGTAFDLFDLDRAQHQSMLEALKMALFLARQS